MIVYHGTAYRWADSLAEHGLVPQAGVGPFVTSDEREAAAFAARSVICDRLSDPDASTLAAMLVIDITNEARLRPDPWHPGQYLLRGGCTPEEVTEWRRFDTADHLARCSDAVHREMGRDAWGAFESETRGAQLRFDCPRQCSPPADLRRASVAAQWAWVQSCRCACVGAGVQPAPAGRLPFSGDTDARQAAA